MSVDTIYRFRVDYDAEDIDEVEKAVSKQQVVVDADNDTYYGGCPDCFPYIELEYRYLDKALEAEQTVIRTIKQTGGEIKS